MGKQKLPEKGKSTTTKSKKKSKVDKDSISIKLGKKVADLERKIEIMKTQKHRADKKAREAIRAERLRADKKLVKLTKELVKHF